MSDLGEYIVIRRSLVPELNKLIAEALYERECERDSMAARARRDPSDLLVADQVLISNTRVAMAGAIGEAVANAASGAPIPF